MRAVRILQIPPVSFSWADTPLVCRLSALPCRSLLLTDDENDKHPILYILSEQACKGANQEGTGYDIYDLYDLGEFDQKGGKATKWGTKEELLSLTKKAKELGVGIMFDAVLNHVSASCFDPCHEEFS